MAGPGAIEVAGAGVSAATGLFGSNLTNTPTFNQLQPGGQAGNLAFTSDYGLVVWYGSYWAPASGQGSSALYANGFVGDGVTDDSAAINAAFAAGGHITFPPRRHITISSGLTIKSGFTTVDFNGCWVDAKAMNGGYAFNLVQDPNPTLFPNTNAPGLYGLFTAANPISNLLLTGPNSNTNNTDGLFIGTLSGSGQVSGQSLSNVQIWGFRDGVYFGNNAYLIAFYQFNISTCWRYGFSYYANTNAGECLSWHGGRISNCNNGGAAFPAAGAAVGLYMQAAGGGHNEMFCHGVSFDYCDNSIVNYGGVLSITGHNEDNTPNPMIQIVGQSSSQATGIYLLGGTMSPTNSSPTARASLVTIDGTNNPKTFFIARCRWTTYGNAATFVTELGGTPQVSIEGSVVDYNSPNSSIFPTIAPTAINRIANPGFEGSESGTQTGSFVAWTQTVGAGQTFSIVSNPVYSGNYAAQIVATGTTNGSLSQETSVVPGQQWNTRILINIQAITAGSIYGTVHFYSLDGTDLISLPQINYTAVTGGWVPVLLSGTVPKGAALASLQVFLSGFTGTIGIDAAEFYAF